MGLLIDGKALSWKETKKYASLVKEIGVTQLLNNWKTQGHLCIESFVWGDETEYMIIRFDHKNKDVKLRANGLKYIKKLLERENLPAGGYEPWKPENASYMLETTPKTPYEDSLDALVGVESSMFQRRKTVESVMDEGDCIVTITGFPLLGCPGFLDPEAHPDPTSGPSRSIFTPAEAICPHVRFITLAVNARERRGKKCVSNVPIYRDRNTPDPFIEMVPSPPLKDAGANHIQPKLVPITQLEPDALPNCVLADSMCFGMGCCCLQATFQACSLRQCRLMYDQLTPMAALMHALSAANPIVRGYLVNTDTRWKIISDVVDDRTDEERGLVPLKESKYRVRKSRYSTVSYYISSGSNPDAACLRRALQQPISLFGGRYYCHDFFKKEYNDIDQTIDKEIYDRLRAENLDEGLSVHYAHIFIRDPLVVYDDIASKSTADGSGSNEFENIQSMNWQSLRFKPPPPAISNKGGAIGWRVEFRSMEVQFTDKENANLAVYTNLLARVVLFFNLDLLIPISLTEKNMDRAQKLNSVGSQKYYFRTDINYPPVNTDSAFFEKYFGNDGKIHSPDVVPCPDTSVSELTLDEIFNGSKELNFVGINNIVRKYLEIKRDLGSLSEASLEHLLKVVDFVAQRCSLKIPTNAMWIREFVRSHSAYKFDSVVSNEIAYDLCVAVNKMGTTGVPYYCTQ